MARKVLSEQLKDAIAADLMRGMTQDGAAQKNGVSQGSVAKIKRERGITAVKDIEPGKKVETTLGVETGSMNLDVVYAEGEKPRWLDIKNPEELLRQCDIDTDVWMIDTCRVSSSEVTMKLREQVGETRLDKPMTYTNTHVSVRLKRRALPELLIDRLCDKLMTSKIKPSKVRYKLSQAPVMLEWCPYDHHHGLLAWKAEVDANWDLNISADFFDRAAIDVLDKASNYNVGKIVIPIGQDWFHCNDPSMSTPHAKHRLDVEGRLLKVFETGYWSLFRGIERFRQIAPVELLWVPGNHDPETSYYMVRALAAHYMDVNGEYNKGVTVDYAPTARKMTRWGNSAIGFSHPLRRGSWQQQRGVFSEVFKEEWASANHHEIHTGHLHKIMEMEFMQADTLGSHTVIRMLPSLCASDKWHWEMGFVDKNRASASFIWTQDQGLACQFTTRIEE